MSIFLLTFIAFLVTAFVSEKVLRRKYNIQKNKYKHVNSFHKWGEFLIIAVFIISGIEWVFNDNAHPMLQYVFPISLTFLWVYRTLMEWKFNRESKEYIISLSGLVCMTVFVPAIIFLNIYVK
ncbi:DUF4181 domain-containing protein [Fictibacillus sp. BK138]|uniref:DUF4181 domain-containing protein n=1 Tax=Fictibacillus sp. BK138 TaxID=2512121 RepID=UPI0010DC17D2|nr:uncharacterized protein DUF4181 [Fictibacillus sp. BK138]